MSDQALPSRRSQSDGRDSHIQTSLHPHPTQMVFTQGDRGGQSGLEQCVPRKPLTHLGRKGFLEEEASELKPAG